MNKIDVKQILNEINFKINQLNANYTPKKYPMVTPLKIMFGLTTCGIVGYSLFHKKIKTHIATGAGEIVKSNEIKTSINDLLNDNKTHSILLEWLCSEKTQQIVTEATQKWLEKQETQAMIQHSLDEWLKKEETQQILLNSAVQLVASNEIEKSTTDLIKKSLMASIPFYGYFYK